MARRAVTPPSASLSRPNRVERPQRRFAGRDHILDYDHLHAGLEAALDDGGRAEDRFALGHAERHAFFGDQLEQRGPAHRELRLGPAQQVALACVVAQLEDGLEEVVGRRLTRGVAADQLLAAEDIEGLTA